MVSVGLPKGWPTAKVDVALGLQAGGALGSELFDASIVSRECARGRNCCGAPSWAAAMWMRLAISRLPCGLRKTKNGFSTRHIKNRLIIEIDDYTHTPTHNAHIS
jgi:hypothetical protein